MVECGLPPEYCEWSGKAYDQDECKKWLQGAHPDLYDEIYPAVEGAAEGDEEAKDDPNAKQARKKKAKKVAFAAEAKKVRVIKLKRGGKKIISSIVGLEKYGCDLADTAKIFARKLGTGAAAM